MTKDEIKGLMFSKVQVRDTLEQPWVDSTLIGFIYGSEKPFITVSGRGDPITWSHMRPTPKITTKVPFTKETAPRHLEVEVSSGNLCVATRRTSSGVHFDDIFISWENLKDYKQWDGSPCYTEGTEQITGRKPTVHLTEAELQDLRAKLRAGRSKNSLAEEFGVTRFAIQYQAKRMEAEDVNN